MQDQPTDARALLLAHFSAAKGTAEHGQNWDDLWKAGILPWDKGSPNPALIDLLSEREDLIPPPSLEEGKFKGRGPRRALVPGCGKGYDVLLLAAFGYEAYGLEISETALGEARRFEREVTEKEEGVYQARHGREKGSVTWISGDFFVDDLLNGVKGEDRGKFDLIYDYTFLSALPPSMRPAWSKRFNELLAPEGRVVCVEFPTYKPPSTGGPPWALPPKVYLGHLLRPGEELPYSEDGDLLEEKLQPSDRGLKRIAHFQPKRTHKIGYNPEGEVTDWVSVWVHQN